MHSYTIRTVGAAVAAVALTTSLVACAGSAGEGDEGGSTVIRLALNNTSSSLSAVVAEEQGFFEAHGLEVESTVMTDITKIPPALGNQYDIGFSVAPLVIRGATQGLGVVAVSGNGTTSDEFPHVQVVTTADSGIESVEDLEGRTLAGPTLTGTLHLGTLQWLEDAGVSAADVDAVQVATPVMMDQLEQGIIDAAELQEPYLTLAESEGFVLIGHPLSSVSETAQESLWIADGSWAEENGEAVAAFRAAISDAAAWIRDNDEEAKAVLAEFTGTDPALLKDSLIMHFTSDIRPEDLEAWGAVMKNVAGFEGTVDAESLVVTP